jgi:hypothetical protein
MPPLFKAHSIRHALDLQVVCLRSTKGRFVNYSYQNFTQALFRMYSVKHLVEAPRY